MVKLDYRTNNPRWGWRGIRFASWESYSYTLGYLSNPNHYNNLHPYRDGTNISIHIEGNDEQGAWDKEGRIHYYGSEHILRTELADLYNCSSAGTGRITKRINSNGYVLSLITDYGFVTRSYMGYTTADVFPPDISTVKGSLERYLFDNRLTQHQIDRCMVAFNTGYYL